jgi:preprotein translocase subunit SecG
MTAVLLVIQFVLTGILTVVILLQKSSSIGLGAYSGSNESVFGAKGPAGFLTKVTFSLSILFILNTLALGYLYNQTKNSSILDGIDVEKRIVPNSSDSNTKDVPQAPTIPTKN